MIFKRFATKFLIVGCSDVFVGDSIIKFSIFNLVFTWLVFQCPSSVRGSGGGTGSDFPRKPPEIARRTKHAETLQQSHVMVYSSLAGDVEGRLSTQHFINSF